MMLMIISGHVFCIPVLCREYYISKPFIDFLKSVNMGSFAIKLPRTPKHHDSHLQKQHDTAISAPQYNRDR